MDLEELIHRYKSFPLSKRLTVIGLLVTIPIIYQTWEKHIVLKEKLFEQEGKRDVAQNRFDRARKQKAELPRLESKLEEIRLEMEEASKKLPNEFIMDKVLQKTSILAQEVGVKLLLFDPGSGVVSSTKFRYVELPIQLELEGSYGQIATFFDRIVHLDLLIHIENMQLSPINTADNLPIGVSPEEANAIKAAEQSLTKEEKQRRTRLKTKLKATTEMIIFRSLSSVEASAVNKTARAEAKKKKKKNKKKKRKNKS